jgi:hypothetical protein
MSLYILKKEHIDIVFRVLDDDGLLNIVREELVLDGTFASDNNLR